MKNFTIFALICFFLLGTFLPTGAREEEILTVKTFISQDGVHPGDTFKVAFLVKIAPGWHINGPEHADEYLIPSELIIDQDAEIKVMNLYYPESESQRFEYSEAEIPVYRGDVLLGALLKVSDDPAEKKHVIKAHFLYQPCNDRSCLPPETLNVEVPFKVVSSSQKIKEINRDIFSKIRFKEKSK